MQTRLLGKKKGPQAWLVCFGPCSLAQWSIRTEHFGLRAESLRIPWLQSDPVNRPCETYSGNFFPSPIHLKQLSEGFTSNQCVPVRESHRGTWTLQSEGPTCNSSRGEFNYLVQIVLRKQNISIGQSIDRSRSPANRKATQNFPSG